MEKGILWFLIGLLLNLLAMVAGPEEVPEAPPAPPEKPAAVTKMTVRMGEEGAMAYDPHHITVRQGDMVELTLENLDRAQAHSFVIRELNFKSRQIAPEKREVARFQVDKAGTFRFFCDVPGHKDAGMVGVLTVEP